MPRERRPGQPFDALIGRSGRSGRARVCGSLLAILLTLLPGLVGAQVYKWTDDEGRKHFSDDLNNVSERYRGRMQILPSVTGTAPATAPSPGGPYAEACKRFTDALEKKRGDPTLRQNVSRCFELSAWEALRAGEAQEASLLFRQALQHDPASSPLLKGLALASIRAGRPEDALEPLERVVKLSADPQATLVLAQLYDQLDQADRAVAHLEDLLRSDPSHADARKLLDKITRERRAEVGYWKDESDHFVVKYSGGEEVARRAVLEVLEEVYVSVGREFNFFPTEKITVILYPEEQFREVTGTPHWVGGFFDGKIRLPVRTFRGRSRALERVLSHEYTHAVVHFLGHGRAPRWLHEGLAQYAEGKPDNPTLRVSGAMTLAVLEALLRDGDSDTAKARLGYEISLRVVRDLLQRGGMERIRELLARLGRDESVADAIPAVYGLPLADLERHWRLAMGG